MNQVPSSAGVRRSSTERSGSGTEDDDEMQEALLAIKDRSKIVTFSPPHGLGWVSVICIIINRMIGKSFEGIVRLAFGLTSRLGTGIYRSPATAINGTQSVGVTLLFWALGALAAFAGTLVYIEFGLCIPRYQWNGQMVSVTRNGGELNYVRPSSRTYIQLTL